jgi:hypothetical protein
MKKPTKKPAVVSVSTLMRRAREAKPAEAKRLRTEAAKLRKIATRMRKTAKDRLAEADDLRRAMSADNVLDGLGGIIAGSEPQPIIGGMDRASAPAWRKGVNAEPTPEQIAWERGREEGRREARAEASRVNVRTFVMSIIDMQDRGELMDFITIPREHVIDTVNALIAAGYGHDGSTDTKG